MTDIVTPDKTKTVAVVGAGAAGIAAARRLRAAGLEVIVLEARPRLGGRALTVWTALDRPVDLGCEWLHAAEVNPWTGIARALRFHLDETLPDWGSRVAWHAGEAAQQDWLAARDALEEAYERAGTRREDSAAAALLPPGGRWNALLDAISTWANGAPLARVSVKDHERYSWGQFNWRVLEGYGTLVAAYGAGLPVRLDTVVERIAHGPGGVTLTTSRGTVRAAAAIVTLPTDLLAAEAIRFDPPLPDKVTAAAGLPLGVANKLFLRLDGPVEALPAGRHVIGAIDSADTGGYMLRPHGWPMIAAYFGGALARRLEEEGIAGMADFAIGEIAGLLGSDIRRRLSPLAGSAWGLDPFARGSYSSALPGHADDRSSLAAPVENRLFFAGEACSVTYFGTAHGALDSGRAAAEQIIAAIAPSATAPRPPAGI